jgi:hypothetical protein
MINVVYQTQEDQETITEVLEHVVPTASRMFADAKRAAAGIMTEYNVCSTKQKSKQGISELNEFVGNLRKYHKDMQTVRNKVAEILDTCKFRKNILTRVQGVKLEQQLQGYLDTLAVAISDFSK